MAELEVKALPKNLKKVFDFTLSEMRKRTDDETFIRQIKLCVEEIFLNISSYAYNPEVGVIWIGIKIDEDASPLRVVMTFKDSGRPFDPLSEEEPDTESGLDERKVGGLGIFLVKNTVDGISYEYTEGQNVLTITKNAG